jgi:hypothetical protein
MRGYNSHNNSRRKYNLFRLPMPTKQVYVQAFTLLLILLSSLQLLMLGSAVAISPAGNVQFNVGIYATLASGDLASSKTSFVPTQSPEVQINYVWIHCGINNEGPTASIRIYLSLASDSIVWYFEFRQVYGGWSGVAQGYADYSNWNNNYAVLDPSGANGGTGESANTGNPFVYPSGGGFNSIARVWAEGAQAQVYAGECQYGIFFTELQQGSSPTPPPPDYSAYYVALVILVPGLALWIYIRTKRPETKHRRPLLGPTGRDLKASAGLGRKLCVNCRTELPIGAKFCDSCGTRQG